MHSRISLVALVCLAGCPPVGQGLSLYAFADPIVTEAQTITLAADAVGVNPTKVVFYDNDVEVAELTARPYHYSWAVTAADDGVHAWTAHAFYNVNGTRAATPFVSNELVFNVDIDRRLLPEASRRAAAYENSREVAIEFAPASTVQYGLASGSDNWPVTWAADGHQYTSWGDGGGFNDLYGTGRVSIGLGRIVGDSPETSTRQNLWGGYSPQVAQCWPAIGDDAREGELAPNGFNICKNRPDPGRNGKSYGILALDGQLYHWVCPGSGNDCYEESRLYRVGLPAPESTPYEDRSAWGDWQRASWAFTRYENGAITEPAFLQYGKNYEGNEDGYVYSYATYLPVHSRPGKVALMRIKRELLNNTGDLSSLRQSDFEYYAGTPGGGENPMWTNEFTEKTPVFENPDGAGWSVSVSYNPVLETYFLISEHTAPMQGNMGLFESDNPWGPWKTVYYGKLGALAFYWNFSNKWLSADGKDFVLVYTGVGMEDDYLVRRGRFITP